MAHLLGSKACIDSLRTDVEDLQAVIYEVVGKTGSIKCFSWKFPDKLATDLDMKELLQRYQYGKHEVDNQVTHIVLFEIIIDRLLLILHGSWRFIDEIQMNIQPDSSSTNHQSNLSIGLVVKKYWNKLLYLQTIVQNMCREVRCKGLIIDRKRDQSLDGTKTHRVKTSSILLRSKTNIDMSSSSNEKRCQTVETSFGPCSSCSKVQTCLRESGDLLINLCHTYNLPSSLAHFRSGLNHPLPEWLSSDDINRWSDNQVKDIERLSKHLEHLQNSLNTCKTELQTLDNKLKKQDELRKKLQQTIQEDKDSKRILIELYDKKLLEQKQEYEQQGKLLDESIRQLTLNKQQLEQKLNELNEDNLNKTDQIQKLELSKNELQILVQNYVRSDDNLKLVEQDRLRTQIELDLMKKDCDDKTREIQKERTRIENMIRQEQTYQIKQKTLTTSLEELTQECESLKKEVNELEIIRDDLQLSLEQTQKQNNHHLTQVADKSKISSIMEANNQFVCDITMLKSNLEQLQQQLRQMDEREQLLIHYPDLNGIIETGPPTNNIVEDMQNQIQANEIRIDLLRRQTESLRSSLEKILNTHNNNQQLTTTTIDEEKFQKIRNHSRMMISERRNSFNSDTSQPTTTKVRQAPLWKLNNEIVLQERTITPTNYIPRFSEQDYVANGWIRSDSDATMSSNNNNNSDIEHSPKRHDRSSSSSSSKTQTTDLIIQAENMSSRPPTTMTTRNSTRDPGRASAIPPASEFEMIIGKGRTSRPSSAVHRNKTNNLTTADNSRRDTSLTKTSGRTTETTAKTTTSTIRSTTENGRGGEHLHCITCNRSYDDKRNFDIHKMYCRN
ncbi:unnamed protein product [Didymodactylos carnosus]|uniref:Coiled-coil domain-containing protein 157 n=1 Tax=Didymodactylos carnosus TaxID=1234261 RepID=A0A814BQ66_9BILA|nr:unnamed protein product [Didymodactylos carnosus]CAF3709218.1 unnamed protein product [Didymodactylos carnosus]